MTLSVRSKLVLNAVLAGAATLVVGLAGWIGLIQLEQAADRLVTDSQALRQQMNTDMRHDTLRADLYSALFQGTQREEERRGNIVKETRVHGEEMVRSLQEAKVLAPPEVKPLMADAEKPLAAYLALANELTALALEDHARAVARTAEFDAAFDKLEVQLARIADGIQAATLEAQAGARRAETIATRAIAGAAVVTTVLLLAFSFLIARGILAPLRRAVSASQAVAAGDLTARLESGRQDEIGALLGALERMRLDLANAVGDIQAAALNVRTGSREIARGNADLSSRTEEQASSLEEASSSMEQFTQVVKQNTDSARQASTLATEASDIAARGGDAVRHAVVTMEGITEASKRIADITSVIDGIAFQTNILALNAAVEAARAGEQGRGFAVVAGEVRSLSQRCAEAAREIKALIEDSTQRIGEGAKQVGGAGRQMEDVTAAIQRVSSLVGEIAEASHEQLRGIEHVGRAVMQMDEVVQQNAALVEESAAAAENLASQAELMAATAGRFKLEGVAAAAANDDQRDLPAAPRVVNRRPALVPPRSLLPLDR